MNPNTKIILESLEDSPQLAEQNRLALDLRREEAARLGQEAVALIEAGGYTSPKGQFVSLQASVERASLQRVSLPPLAPLPSGSALPTAPILRLSVKNRTTMEASQSLIAQGKRPLALNFAAPVHPGGGFLRGSRAQEETIARSSGLYATLKDDPMYAYHAAHDSLTATDWAILSPDVPVFRTDSGTLLEETWSLSILTCAAPQAVRMPICPPGLMESRIDRVLLIAQAYGYRTLVLGAWGCGAFGNDPGVVSNLFRKAIMEKFLGDFEGIVFAISDWSPDRRFLTPFQSEFERAIASPRHK